MPIILLMCQLISYKCWKQNVTQISKLNIIYYLKSGTLMEKLAQLHDKII